MKRLLILFVTLAAMVVAGAAAQSVNKAQYQVIANQDGSIDINKVDANATYDISGSFISVTSSVFGTAQTLGDRINNLSAGATAQYSAVVANNGTITTKNVTSGTISTLTVVPVVSHSLSLAGSMNTLIDAIHRPD